MRTSEKNAASLANLKLFEKGNPGGPGRPPMLLSTVVADLRRQGYERASAATVVEAFEMLMNVPEDELRKMVTDKNQPMSLRIVGKAMLTAKGWEVLQAMMDRAHGKARQSLDVSGELKGAEPPRVTIQVLAPTVGADGG